MARTFKRDEPGATVPFERRPHAEQYFRLANGSFIKCGDDFWLRHPRAVCILYVVQMSGDLLSVEETIVPQSNCKLSNIGGKYKVAIEAMKRRHRKNLLLRLTVDKPNED